MIIRQLISLLRSNPEQTNVSECLKAINGAEELRYRIKFDNCKSLPLDEAIDIYRTRLKTNTELNHKAIKGLEDLISALENAKVQTIRLLSLELLEKWYVVFTDDDISELFGVLYCPKVKSAWSGKTLQKDLEPKDFEIVIKL